MKTKKKKQPAQEAPKTGQGLIEKAAAAQRLADSAHKHLRQIKAEHKMARKAYRQARKAARQARKVAKAMSKSLPKKLKKKSKLVRSVKAGASALRRKKPSHAKKTNSNPAAMATVSPVAASAVGMPAVAT